MTNKKKELDFSNLLNLLDEEDLKNIKKELASQALNNVPIEYEEYEVKLTVPKTVADFLRILTDILPLDIEVILSKMASQGLSNILEGATEPVEETTGKNPLDGLESINKMTDKLSSLQATMQQFSNLGQVLDIQNLTKTK